MTTSTRTTRTGTTAARSRAGLPAAVLGAGLGLGYVALNLYWAAGGDRWLAEYGSHLIGRSDGDAFRVSSLVLAALLLAEVLLVIRAVTMPFDAPARPAVRWLAWVGAGLIALYGMALTAIGLYIQLDVGGVRTDEPRLYRWHAFLWDPWFLLLGVVLVAALTRSARAYVAATGRDPV
jgi:hypothetical protein